MSGIALKEKNVQLIVEIMRMGLLLTSSYMEAFWSWSVGKS